MHGKVRAPSIYCNSSLRFCTVSPLDSVRCIEYVRSNRFKYDILSPTATQLKALSSTHIHLKTELEDAFEK